MTLDYEREYNNIARVPEIKDIAPRWARESEAVRARVRADLDVPYGPDPRHRFDAFLPDTYTPGDPLAIFIHGGYWQGRDRKDFSFTATGALAHGIGWLMPSYRLCPEVRIADIVDDMRACLGAAWQRYRVRPLVTGHSAGGHLTAALLGSNASTHADTPSDLVRAGYALSGVFDVAPLVGTSIGAALRETADSARAVSPMFAAPPPSDRWLVAAVGGAESGEFIRQSVDMAGAWSRHGVKTEAVIIPSANHFTILDELARPESAMCHRIAALARACAAP